MQDQQKRLTILMIEIEQPEGLTARKLVAETMKHNVITAYSAEEGLALFVRNTADVVLVHSRVAGAPAQELVRAIREQKPAIPVMVVRSSDVSDESREEFDADAFIRPHHVEDMVAFLDKLSMDILHSRPAEHPNTEVTHVTP